MELFKGQVAVVTGAGSDTPAFIAHAVGDAVQNGQFWVIPQQDFLDVVVERWDTIAERVNPSPASQTPGMPPPEQLMAEVMAALVLSPPSDG